MWSKLVTGSGITVALALFAGIVWGEVAVRLVIFLVGLVLLGWLVNAYVWVRVPALEAALVFNVETVGVNLIENFLKLELRLIILLRVIVLLIKHFHLLVLNQFFI